MKREKIYEHRQSERGAQKRNAIQNKLLNILAVIFLFISVLGWGGGVESILGPLGTAATTGLLYLPRVNVRMEKLVE
jgi:hypothetical protein